MKRAVFIIILFLVLGWDWDTHKGFIESSFSEFPDELKEKLSLPLMGDGSLIPDRDFHDFTNHSYPKSLSAVDYWFNVSKKAYLGGDYKTASIAFGVGSHYLSDSLAAPHAVSNENYGDHREYEDQALVDFKVKCKNINLKEELSRYYDEKKLEWGEWLKDKKAKYPKQSSSEAADLVYSSALQLFDFKCEQNVGEDESSNIWWILLVLILIIVGYLVYRRYF